MKPRLLHLFLIAMLILPVFLQAQHIGPFVGWYTQKQVKRILEKNIRRDKGNHLECSLEQIGDTLYYTVSGSTMTSRVKVTFHLGRDVCDYQEVATTCGSCAEKRKEELFKYFKWRISNHEYATWYGRRQIVEIIENPSTEFCSVVKCRYNTMTKLQYKEAVAKFKL